MIQLKQAFLNQFYLFPKIYISFIGAIFNVRNKFENSQADFSLFSIDITIFYKQSQSSH